MLGDPVVLLGGHRRRGGQDCDRHHRTRLSSGRGHADAGRGGGCRCNASSRRHPRPRGGRRTVRVERRPGRVPVVRRMPTSWPDGRTSTSVTTPARRPRSTSRASWTNTVSPRRRAFHWNFNITPPAAGASRMRSHGSHSHHCGVGVGARVESPGNMCRHRQQRRSATSVSSNRASDVPGGRSADLAGACRGDLVDGQLRAVRCQPLGVVLCRAGRANGGVRRRPERHGPRGSRAVGPAPVPVTRRESRR